MSVIMASYLLALMMAGEAAGAPPHAPNFCSSQFCVEIQPIISGVSKGFLVPTRHVTEEDDTSRMELNFNGFGSLIIVGPQRTTVHKSSVEWLDDSSILVVSCEVVRSENICNQFSISTESSSRKAREIMCSMISFWKASEQEDPTRIKLGSRMEMATQLMPLCRN